MKQSDRTYLKEYYPIIVFPQYYEDIRKKEIKFNDLFPNKTYPQKPYFFKSREKSNKNSDDFNFILRTLSIWYFPVMWCFYISLMLIHSLFDLGDKMYVFERPLILFSPVMLFAIFYSFYLLFGGGIKWGSIKTYFKKKPDKSESEKILKDLISALKEEIEINGNDYVAIKQIISQIEKYEKQYFIEKQITLPDKWDMCEPIFYIDEFYINKFINGKKYLEDIDYEYYFYVSQKINIYERDLNLYNNAYEKFNDVYIKQFKRNNLLLISLENKNNILHNSKIISLEAPKKGIAEDYFHDYLIKYPEFVVYKSLKYQYYYPDLTLLHKETNIFIDIEIDEPYSFEERKPIHFDDSDSKRDKYFAECGFVVIRFTEDQIIDNAYKCYIIIKKCISELNNFISASDFMGNNDEYKYIKSKAWSYEESFNMAYKHTRKDINNRIAMNIANDTL